MIKYLLCAGAGVGIGYFIAQRRLESLYFDRLQEETEEARTFYKEKYDKKLSNARNEGAIQAVVDLEGADSEEFTKAAIEATEALQKYQGIEVKPSVLAQELTRTMEKAAEEPEPEHETVVEGSAEDFDTGPLGDKNPEEIEETAEEATRRANLPRLITADEYINSETGFQQFSVTYFAGDDVISTEADKKLSDTNRKISFGRDILEMLKAGPEAMGGVDAIYVRSPQIKMEFDVVLSSGKYSVEVLGETG